ncbi:MAG: hypothetical protein ABIH26_01440 [Candidatus Eisenbacteria bacterium]
MVLHLLIVFLHIMTSIFWIGYALFWSIIVGPVARSYSPAEGARLLESVNRAPWPPRKIPTPVRLDFSQIGWLLIGVLAVTGVLLAVYEGAAAGGVASGRFLLGRFGRVLAAKLLFVLLAAGLQFRLASRPGPRAAHANLLAAVVVIVLSALLARSVGK